MHHFVHALHGGFSSLRDPFHTLTLLLCIPQGSAEVVLEAEDQVSGVTLGVVPAPEGPQVSPRAGVEDEERRKYQ